MASESGMDWNCIYRPPGSDGTPANCKLGKADDDHNENCERYRTPKSRRCRVKGTKPTTKAKTRTPAGGEWKCKYNPTNRRCSHTSDVDDVENCQKKMSDDNKKRLCTVKSTTKSPTRARADVKGCFYDTTKSPPKCRRTKGDELADTENCELKENKLGASRCYRKGATRSKSKSSKDAEHWSCTIGESGKCKRGEPDRPDICKPARNAKGHKICSRVATKTKYKIPKDATSWPCTLNASS